MKVNRRIGTAGIGAVLVAAALVVPQWDAGAATAQTWQLTPPGGTGPAATVSLDGTGRLSLAVRDGSATVLQPSALGLRTSATDRALRSCSLFGPERPWRRGRSRGSRTSSRAAWKAFSHKK